MKCAVIIGGAGGLGSAASEYFADKLWRVFSLDICMPASERKGVTDIVCDVTSEDSVNKALAEVSASVESVDALIYAAGLYMMDSLVEIEGKALSRIMDVNLMGAFRVNKAFLPLVRAVGGRMIIITSELAGRRPLPFNGVYSLSKTALEHYADSLRLELWLLGVRVITVRPGAFNTDMINASNSAMKAMNGRTKLYEHSTARFKAVMDSQTGTARPPKKLAAVLFRAASVRHPRLCYTVNPGFLLGVYGALPYIIQRSAIKALLTWGRE